MTETNKITFKPAVRENVGLWINLIGGTGSGKTWTAMELASGISGDKPFALIDTENRRGLHYADSFNFHHAELNPPFTPAAYAEAVLAADAAGYPVIVIDSGSHVWSGDGGVLDMQADEVDRMAGDNYGKRESVKMAAWIKPKTAHKKMVQALLRVKAHIILCLRAEEKIEMVKGQNGKLEIRAKHSLTGLDGWIPICDKALPFEATVSFLLIADKPGMPHPIKLQEQHKAIFPLDRPINAESGKLLAQWASGGETKKADTLETKRTNVVKHFGDMGVSVERICAAVGVASVDLIGEDDIVKLKAIATDIKAGDKSIIEAFPEIIVDRPEIPTEPIDKDSDDPATPQPQSEVETVTASDSPDALANRRANIQIMLDDLPGKRGKDLIAGKTPVSKMDDAELDELLVLIEKENAQ